MITLDTPFSEPEEYPTVEFPEIICNRKDRRGRIIAVLCGPAGTKQIPMDFADVPAIPERVIVDNRGTTVIPEVPGSTHFTDFYEAWTNDTQLHEFGLRLLSEKYAIDLQGTIDLTNEPT